MQCYHELIGQVLSFRKDMIVYSTPSAFTIRHVSEYVPEDWDVTLLLTDDDWSFPINRVDPLKVGVLPRG